ncbi:uncharacterized protein MYCFIDRAFT_191970 [Pseudocercospora fijiensis CIRAD86]|uniref:Uncharacterized protein n=1 Tax=Pseudocercospora fijiensis (strain CIRAD86) TaxID=383855 RepID=N1Q608_PSEFD|nr:uncharacterized protein MYCFIDRAFT_191970 [Pseudocercospora fijiensis CIRAD86]EME87575.1 hypothetical protein MYCFIDRAFT_191970 [Pseudocercospora fijiensis CIRAD86]
MPTFVVPHRSGAHRVAAIALYRALLTQCKRTSLPAVHGEELHNLIKNRFRGFRYDTSHRHQKVAFEAGYEAVDYLDAAVNGEVGAKEYILALLKRAPRNAKIDPRESPKQFLRRHYASQAWPDHLSLEEKEGPASERKSDRNALAEAEEMNESAHQLFSEETASLERSPTSTDDGNGSQYSQCQPLQLPPKTLSGDEELSQAIFGKPHQSDLPVEAQEQNPPIRKRRILFDPPIAKENLGGTGKRHVPVLVNANGIPFLRYKKPMPANLAAFVNSRILQRDRRHKFRIEMEHNLHLAQEEDRWDSILYKTAGVDSSGGGVVEGSWKDVSERSLQGITNILQSEKENNRIHAERMQAIVDREAELANLEMKEDERKALGALMDNITDQPNITDQDSMGGEHDEESSRPLRLFYDMR